MAAQQALRIAYANKLTPLLTVAAGSADPLFPALRSMTDVRGELWHATGDTSETYTIDLGSAQACTVAAFLDHNLTSVGTIKVEAHTSNTWAGAQTLVQAATVVVGNPSFIFFAASHTFRWWRFTFVDAANPDTYIKVGKMYLGTYIQPARNYRLGWGDFKTSNSTVSISDNNVERWNVKRQGRSIQMAFRTTTADKVLVDALVAAVDRAVPFFLMGNLDGAPSEGRYVRLASMPEPRQLSYDRWEYGWLLREAL